MISKDMYQLGWEQAIHDMNCLNSFMLMLTVKIIKEKTIDVNKNVEYWDGYSECLKEFDYEEIFV